MPSRNVIKEFAPGQYYHIYNRGVAKLPIFLDAQDKHVFLKILRRHLDPHDKSLRDDGVVYRKFNTDIELLCYCLMGNHFHLLFYVKEDGDPNALSVFMQSAMTAYTMYFNKRHKRVGALFQGVFKASRITNENYLTHITRYIHINPQTYKTYAHSSIGYYLGQKRSSWLNQDRVLAIFEGEDYSSFLEDYEEQKLIMEEIKSELANYRN
ncbi:MAG: transposase [Candidatus Saccharimonadales bacterium]